jgi:hypothetical protein
MDGPEVLWEQGITKSSETIHPSFHRLFKCSEFQNVDKTFLKFDSADGAIRTLALTCVQQCCQAQLLVVLYTGMFIISNIITSYLTPKILICMVRNHENSVFRV